MEIYMGCSCPGAGWRSHGMQLFRGCSESVEEGFTHSSGGRQQTAPQPAYAPAQGQRERTQQKGLNKKQRKKKSRAKRGRSSMSSK